ncbi:tRNA (N(6)-L-threonylcarbamoyladenosine(37)-C(2))-methylthiotransferase [Candidatus Micrarchaeota archaeon]|nr:tRNA (N(6)-L-threonylcarbamoyladenosine(37)-C(2))-methylthiotransferase [Candidatus Micrarchaeota archaeon]
MQKIFLKTYGCTLNQSDSDLIEAMLDGGGHEFVKSADDADTIIVNTCAVKETTENKILWYLKDLESKGKKVIVAGCLTTANLPAVKKASPKAIAYVGPNSVGKIPLILENDIHGRNFGSENGNLDHENLSNSNNWHLNNNGNSLAIQSNQPNSSMPSNSPILELKDDFASKFDLTKKYGQSIFARIQTSSGCMSNCTFCATKIARGKFKSKPPSLILNEARLAIKSRAKEIQLASQDNGCYGYDLQTSIPKLLPQLNDLDGRFRIRVGMANPQHFLKNIDEWLEAFRLPKVYKFLHLPIQSGSNRILKLMNRGYTIDQAIDVAKEFRKKFPDMTLETDVIVGFPGETEAEFEQSLDVCSQLGFEVVNFAKYSKRPGTKAAKMVQIDTLIKKKRSEIINTHVKQIALSQNQKLIGNEYDVLITEEGKNGYMQGRAQNYRPVLIKKLKPDGSNWGIGEFAHARIADASVTSLIAK